jgi:hypothetical protein
MTHGPDVSLVGNDGFADGGDDGGYPKGGSAFRGDNSDGVDFVLAAVAREGKGGGGIGWDGRRLLLLTMRPEEKRLIRNGERGKC